ncbi:hypothetical protein F2Q70_00032009 [Brassica cretica]|uniref:Uncharacterized protein n=1 Tax=Brassica cretica TaxID=69181 RepID=A0A8S9FLL4_BRACR|nr:hypothetical protein F2Q70_00032009 [Brassica cretica]
MSSAVSPIANAVVAYSTFDSLGLRRTGQYVVGSLICFWNSQNTKKNGEFMGITLLLLDELPDSSEPDHLARNVFFGFMSLLRILFTPNHCTFTASQSVKISSWHSDRSEGHLMSESRPGALA